MRTRKPSAEVHISIATDSYYARTHVIWLFAGAHSNALQTTSDIAFFKSQKMIINYKLAHTHTKRWSTSNASRIRTHAERQELCKEFNAAYPFSAGIAVKCNSLSMYRISMSHNFTNGKRQSYSRDIYEQYMQFVAELHGIVDGDFEASESILVCSTNAIENFLSNFV